MAIDAYIGQPFVFQTVFLDPLTGAPLAVTGVNVTLYYYTVTPATRLTLLNAVAMSAVTPASPSRYSYQYRIEQRAYQAKLTQEPPRTQRLGSAEP